MSPLCQTRPQPGPICGLDSVCLKPVPRSAVAQILNAVEIDPDQLERFLGPRYDIIAAIRAGAAHALLAILSSQELIGFYVLHPDRRDGACWWLGWFALDRRRQGQGFGRVSMAQIMRRFRRIPGCRRVRLLVAPDNTSARRLYTQAGFNERGATETGELLLETTLWTTPTSRRRHSGRRPSGQRRNVARLGHRSLPGRLRLLAGPYAARVIGVERGPPV